MINNLADFTQFTVHSLIVLLCKSNRSTTQNVHEVKSYNTEIDTYIRVDVTTDLLLAVLGRRAPNATATAIASNLYCSIDLYRNELRQRAGHAAAARAAERTLCPPPPNRWLARQPARFR